jgi:hypothetical protein
MILRAGLEPLEQKKYLMLLRIEPRIRGRPVRCLVTYVWLSRFLNLEPNSNSLKTKTTYILFKDLARTSQYTLSVSVS